MQHHLCFTSWQRPFDYRQKIFPTKQCWRIVAALAGLFLLAISPYTRADQSSAAVAQSTAEGDAGNKPLRKLSLSSSMWKWKSQELQHQHTF